MRAGTALTTAVATWLRPWLEQFLARCPQSVTVLYFGITILGVFHIVQVRCWLMKRWSARFRRVTASFPEPANTFRRWNSFEMMARKIEDRARWSSKEALPGHSGMGEIESVFVNLVGRAFGRRGRQRVSEVRTGRFARTRLPVGNISTRTAAEKRIRPAERKRPQAFVFEVGQLGLLVRSQDLVKGSIRFGFGGSGLSDFLS
jgi:hypothetical protein